MPASGGDDEFAESLRAGERAMSAHAGAPVRLGRPERLTEPGRRSLALRSHVLETPTAGLPETVILKRALGAEYHPDEPEGAAARLFNDWAGAAFLGELPDAPGLAPRYYGGDHAVGLVTLEDLGTGATLVDPLRGDDPAAAVRALLALATTLGRLHAVTIGHAGSFQALRAGLGPVGTATFVHTPGRLRERLPSIEAALARAGLALDEPARAEIAATLEALEEPGPFWAYTHGDPCPDNDLLDADGRVRLIDFEMGTYRHALIDGVYGLMQFPTCWCAGRIPDKVLALIEAAYRGELTRGCPEAENDASWHRAVAQAAAYWMFVTLWWLLDDALTDDEEWGIAWVRPRIVSRLEAFARVAVERGEQLPALTDLARRLSAALRQCWPADRCELPLYPAFCEPPSGERGVDPNTISP